MTKALDREQLLRLLSLDPVTGVLRWKPRSKDLFKTASQCKAWNTRHAGRAAGSVSMSGRNGDREYLTIRFGGKAYLVHRVVMTMLGYDCTGMEVDHINGVGTDNRPVNLRVTTNAGNGMNARRQRRNRTGVTGVGISLRGKPFYAFIIQDGKRDWIGSFDHIFEAAAARKSAEIRCGFGPAHGQPLP